MPSQSIAVQQNNLLLFRMSAIVEFSECLLDYGVATTYMYMDVTGFVKTQHTCTCITRIPVIGMAL